MTFKHTFTTALSTAAVLLGTMQAAHAANWNIGFKATSNTTAIVSWELPQAPSTNGTKYKVCWERKNSSGTLCNNNVVEVNVTPNSSGYSASSGVMGVTINNLSCNNEYKVRVKRVNTLAMDNGTFDFDC